MPPLLLRTLLPLRAVLTPKLRGALSKASSQCSLQHLSFGSAALQSRAFRPSLSRRIDESHPTIGKDSDHTMTGSDESKLEESIAQEKEKQTRAPWHREGSELPPVARRRSAGAMTKGTEGSILQDHVQQVMLDQANSLRRHPAC